MLFILTGKVQIGKSRWLEGLVSCLAERGVPSYGVLSPGVWVESSGPQADANGFEKLGIQSVLLPDGARFSFATRRDLAPAGDGAVDASQSDRANLGWRISEVSLARVNGHFRSLGLDTPADAAAGLLVVDEVGRLEVKCGGGLTEATSLLEEGPRALWPHALAVARRSLADRVDERFGRAWGGSTLIAPGPEAEQAILRAFDQLA